MARVINSMLSELNASHTRFYTPDEPEYYQLADIFVGALRRRGLQRAFPDGRISYPGIGIISRFEATGRNTITGVIDGTPAQQAGLRAGDEIIAADGTAFEPIRSFRGKVGKSVVLEVHRSASGCKSRSCQSTSSPRKCSSVGWSRVRASLSPMDDASAMSMFGAMPAPSINVLLNACCRKGR
ncbi:PDZ domain-containing protein [Bradyrhizobium sp. 164]|nr:PDZ domain-containing protein [Bradyrhizobium sp. 164]